MFLSNLAGIEVLLRTLGWRMDIYELLLQTESGRPEAARLQGWQPLGPRPGP